MATGAHKPDKPPRSDPQPGKIAICATSDEFIVFEYRQKYALSSQYEWFDTAVDLRALALGKIEGAELERDPNTGRVWLYADEIDPNEPIDVQEEPKDTEKTNEDAELTEIGQYVLEFSDGKVIAGNAQVEAMGKAINHLIDEHALLNEIDIPYMSGYKNALINVRKQHPDGREMKRPHETSEGYYVETSMSREQKKEYIEELASKVGLLVEFKRGWHEGEA